MEEVGIMFNMFALQKQGKGFDSQLWERNWIGIQCPTGAASLVISYEPMQYNVKQQQ